MRKSRDTLSTRDAEDLEEYAASLRLMGLPSQGFEPAGSPTYETPSAPHGFDSFSDRSNTALARSIHARLIEASVFYAPTGAVLLAMHSPAAVACDGKAALSREDEERIREAARHGKDWKVREQLDVGRRLAVYPMTWTADECRRWRALAEERVAVERMASGIIRVCGGKGRPGPRPGEAMMRAAKLLALDGRRAMDLFGEIAAAKRDARGEEAELWRAMDAEAQLLIRASASAWNAAPGHRERRVRMRTDKLGPREAA